jgi:hypothetical protein
VRTWKKFAMALVLVAGCLYGKNAATYGDVTAASDCIRVPGECIGWQAHVQGQGVALRMVYRTRC